MRAAQQQLQQYNNVGDHSNSPETAAHLNRNTNESINKDVLPREVHLKRQRTAAETFYSTQQRNGGTGNGMTNALSSAHHLAAGMTSATTASHRKTVTLQKNFTRGTIGANDNESPNSTTLKPSH